jgi:molecular chaperone DnaJ
MSDKDLYGVLGVSKNASDDEIKKAYRKLSKKHHPDLNKGDKDSEKKFKEINTAYEVLSDKQKRMQYDQFGGIPGAGGGGFGTGAGFQGAGFDFSGFSGGFADVFETFFGAGGGQGAQARHAKQSRGPDIEITLQLTFEEAAFGCSKEISISHFKECDHCKGSGAEPGAKVVSCSECHGTGEITTVQNTFIGQMRSSKICPKCSGRGKVPEKKCSTCHGEGRIKTSSKITVNVPAGVDNGTTLRLTGKGNAGSFGRESGDLYVHIISSPSNKFERHGNDIKTSLAIHVSQAILGDEIEIDTIHGKVTLKIPTGTSSGTTLRLKGYGVQRINSSQKGDHLIKINVDIPKKVSQKEKDHYLELAKISKEKGKGIWGKLFS